MFVNRDQVRKVDWVMNPFFFLSLFSLCYFVVPHLYLSPFLGVLKLKEDFFKYDEVAHYSLWWFWCFFISYIITSRKGYIFSHNLKIEAEVNLMKLWLVKVVGIFIFVFTIFLMLKHYETLKSFLDSSRTYSHAFFYDVIYKPNKLEVYLTAGFGVIVFFALFQKNSYWALILLPTLALEYASGGRTLTFQAMIFCWLVNVYIYKKNFLKFFVIGSVLILTRVISRLSFLGKTIDIIWKEFLFSVGGEFGFTKISTLLAIKIDEHGSGLSYIKNCMFKLFPPLMVPRQTESTYESILYNYYPKSIWFGIGGSPISEVFFYFNSLGVILSPLVLVAYFLLLIKLQRNKCWWILFLYFLHLSYMANFFRHGFWDLIFNNIHSFIYFMLPIIILVINFEKNNTSRRNEISY